MFLHVFKRASSEMFSSNSIMTEYMPSLSHVFVLLFTYVCDAGLLPTKTTANPGVTPCDF